MRRDEWTRADEIDWQRVQDEVELRHWCRCLTCGRGYRAKHERRPSQRVGYCSDECRRAADARRHREARAALTAERQPLRLDCELCGEQYEATRRDAKYCSVACRVAAHRHRP